MAKTSGLGDRLYVTGYNISGDVGKIDTLATPRAVLESTGIDKSAMERLPGLRDGQIEFTAFFNPAEDQAHERLSALPTTDVIVTYTRGTTAGDPTASMVAKQVTYDAERGDDGSLTFGVNAQANGYGLEWGKQMTAGIRNDGATPTNGTIVDFGTGTQDFGLQAFLHVLSIDSGSATIKLQESADDDGDPDTFADVTGGAFSAVTAVGAERIQTSRTLTVERYLRVVTTGTFTGLSFIVGCRVNKYAVTF